MSDTLSLIRWGAATPATTSGFIVKRRVGWHTMFLVGWDVIWGPCWSLNEKHAIRHQAGSLAIAAIEDAVAIMKPVPWRVPSMGSVGTLWLEAL